MKGIALFTFFCFSVLAGGVAYAQTSTPTTTASSEVAETTQVEAERPGRQVQLSERAQERVINLAANLSNRFDSVIARLQTIHNRLDARLNILESQGYNVNEARGYVATGKTSLDIAAANMSDIDDAVVGFATAPNARTAWIDVRTRYTETRNLVRSAHADLRAAIAAAKNAQVPQSNDGVEVTE